MMIVAVVGFSARPAIPWRSQLALQVSIGHNPEIREGHRDALELLHRAGVPDSCQRKSRCVRRHSMGSDSLATANPMCTLVSQEIPAWSFHIQTTDSNPSP